MKKYCFMLSKEQRQVLQPIIADGQIPVRKLMHTRILLKADEGEHEPDWTNVQISRALEMSLAPSSGCANASSSKGWMKPSIVVCNQGVPRSARSQERKRLIRLPSPVNQPKISALGREAVGGRFMMAKMGEYVGRETHKAFRLTIFHNCPYRSAISGAQKITQGTQLVRTVRFLEQEYAVRDFTRILGLPHDMLKNVYQLAQVKRPKEARVKAVAELFQK